MLALVLAGALKRPLATFLQERIWQPMGAEADASWIVDAAGQETGFTGLNAVLRDYARFGLLLAHGGRSQQRQLHSGSVDPGCHRRLHGRPCSFDSSGRKSVSATAT